MLVDPRAKDMLQSFREQWLRLEKLASVTKSASTYKEWSSATVQAAQAESQRFFEGVLLEGDGKMATLFRSPQSWVDGQLAKLYGIPGVTGTALERRDLSAAERAGFLTQIAFLATNATDTASHPVKRGVVVAESLLCLEIPPPMVDVPPPKPPAPNLSTRERFEEHGRAECARGCHAVFDPLGFAFEAYDAVGRYRKEDGGKPVDASGEVTLGGTKRSFKGAVELAHLLSESDEARRCLSSTWLRFALGRALTDDDHGTLAAAHGAFADAGHDVRALLLAVARGRSFLYRRPNPGEVTR
jgi:hypothetical protein